MMWINSGSGNGNEKLIFSDDLSRQTKVVVLDFKDAVSLPEVLSNIAVMGRDFRFSNITDVDGVRHYVFGDKAPEAIENDEPDVFEMMTWRQWFGYPMIRILDRMIEWCCGAPKGEDEHDSDK